MLHRLVIQNLVLVTNCDIGLKPGFNVITGETGAGKSVFLTALSLLMGDRADVQVVRHGEEMAIVEATFSSWDQQFEEAAQEMGLEFSDESFLIIRREVFRSGKSRALINGQVVANTHLKRLTPLLVEECGQHAHLKLKQPSAARELLDQYAQIAPTLAQFKNCLDEERDLEAQSQKQQLQLKKRNQRVEELLEIITEIEEARLKEGEEEQLFEQYGRLEHTHELLGYIQTIQTALDNDRAGVISVLKRLKPVMEKAHLLSQNLEVSQTHLLSGLAELEELSYQLQKESSRIDLNPSTLAKMKERLTLYDKLKRRYGSSLEEIQSYLQQCKAELTDLEELDERIANTHERLKKIRVETNTLAQALHTQRTTAAHVLSKALELEIKSLNTPHATFKIDVSPTARTVTGDDKCTFFLTPNPGEKEVAVHESASGGELARVFLSLQLVLFQNGPKRTLLFDEVDANIGGATATVVGKKLKLLGESTQILCITHFPQVAHHADSHFRIEKEVVDGRTVSQILELISTAHIENEIQRMMGQEAVQA